MLLGLWIARDIKQVRGVMFAGSSVLVALSVLLTILDGLIPSSKAAKSDPVTALRTE